MGKPSETPKSLRVLTAKPSGFCFGVRRAVGKLEKALRRRGHVYSIGSPIHNPQETARLERMGLVLVERAEDIPDGAAVFIRAHGLSARDRRMLEKRGVELVDGTCPFVLNVQRKAEFLGNEGYHVVVLGDEKHPEVQAIAGSVEGGALVLPPGGRVPEDLKGRRIGIVSQTTQRPADLSDLVSRAAFVGKETRIYNTICKATVDRQRAAEELAGIVDGMIVIGGRNSANTGKLFAIARSFNTETVWIEQAGELDRRWLEGKGTIGIAAGASTPDRLILDLITMLVPTQGVKEDGR
ncbi:MAG: 4-hydroxy-3-methylbut-2-enyl diphosphate reductase [Thermovirgaceae bacterium]